MSEITKEKIDEYADKLLIGLTPEENEMVLQEFNVIQNNMELINTIKNLKDVEPMTHTLDDFTYELTPDKDEENISIEDALKNCDVYEDREIKVPKVV